MLIKQQLNSVNYRKKIFSKLKLIGIALIVLSQLIGNKIIMASSKWSEPAVPLPPESSIGEPIYNILGNIEWMGVIIGIPIIILWIKYQINKKGIDEQKQKKKKQIINILVIISWLMLIIPSIIMLLDDIKYYSLGGIINNSILIFLITGMDLGTILCKKVNKLGFFVLITLMIGIYIVPFIMLFI